MSTSQIVCLAVPEQSSAGVWEETDERKPMKEAVYQLPNPEETWRKFLEFDDQITRTILKECQENNIPVCLWDKTASADDLAERVARVLGIQEGYRW
jgi:hypothetical protein